MEIEKENPTISPTDDDDKFFSNNGLDNDADSISLSSSSDQDDNIDIEQGDDLVGGRQSKMKKTLSRQGSLNQSILAPLPFGSMMFADLESPFENDDDIEGGGISDLDTSQKSVSTRGSRRSSLPNFLQKYSPSGEDIDGSQHSRGSSTRSGRRHSMKRIGSSTSLRNLQRRMSSKVSSFSSPKIKKRKEKFHYRSRQSKAQLDEMDANESIGKEKKRVRFNAWINYEVFMWTWFIVLTVLAVVDRFGWNVWPRQVRVVKTICMHMIWTCTFNSNKILTLSVPAVQAVIAWLGLSQARGRLFYMVSYCNFQLLLAVHAKYILTNMYYVTLRQLSDCLARISGRYSIICYNFILITKLECLEILLTTPFVRKYLLDTSNIINANTRLHNWNGIGLCVMTLLQ